MVMGRAAGNLAFFVFFWRGGGTFNLAALLRQQTKTPGSLAAVTAQGGKMQRAE